MNLIKKILLMITFLTLTGPSALYAITPTELITQMQSNQAKIQDLEADITTTMTTVMPNLSKDSKMPMAPQSMVQKAHMLTKGTDKSKMTMTSPIKQTTIMNGDKMAIIDNATGKKMVQDLSKLRSQSGMPASSAGGQNMDISKIMDAFNLEVKEIENGYKLTGTPKKEDKFLGKMEFVVDKTTHLVKEANIYNTDGALLSNTKMEYTQIKDVWAPNKNISTISMPRSDRGGPSSSTSGQGSMNPAMGGMNVEVVYNNVKVNQGIKDAVFKIE